MGPDADSSDHGVIYLEHVRQATGKPNVAKFEGAYHGSHNALEVSTACGYWDPPSVPSAVL